MNPPLDVPLIPSENGVAGQYFEIVSPEAVHDLRHRRIDELHYCATAALVIAGVPGAGKSTALWSLFGSSSDAEQPPYGPDGAVVLDSNHVRNAWRHRLFQVPYPLWRPLVHLTHYHRVWLALRDNNGPVVIHECATAGWSRKIIAHWAARRGRQLHLILLDVPAAVARAGQFSRGRRVNRLSFRLHCWRWKHIMQGIGSDRSPVPHAASIVIADRSVVDRLRRIAFGT